MAWGRTTTKCMRQVREERISRCFGAVEKEKAQKQNIERRERDYIKMREVVAFFFEKYPERKNDEFVKQIEKMFSQGTKSQYGMILWFDKIASGCTEWKKSAFAHFNIHI